MIANKQTFEELQDSLRRHLLVYLRRAYQQIPPLVKPHILDIGCGSGVPTIELARLSGGTVTGIDIDTEALRRLELRAKTSGLTDRVQVVHGSMKHMKLPDASFDILWAEGSIAFMGFKQGLRAWKRFLKPDGYLVIHDEAGDINQKLNHIKACGFTLVDWFELGQRVWWQKYYAPLNDVVQQLRKQEPNDPQLLKTLERAQHEIEGYHLHPERYRSVYFIMCKDTE